MIECALQLRDDYTVKPFSQEDLDKVKEFKPNQILRGKLWGVKKPRSLIQLRLYWVLCQTVADNLDGVTKEDVDWKCKKECKLIKRFEVEKDKVFIEMMSVAIANLPHMEACNYFDRAFKVMAKILDVKVEELLKNASES